MKESDIINPDTLWIEDEQNITDNLIDGYAQTKFIKLGKNDLENIFEYKDTLTLYKIYPLNFEDKQFSVMLAPFRVTMKDKLIAYTYAYSGCYIIYFDFRDNKFIFRMVANFRM